MAEARRITIEILGQRLTIRSEASDERVRELVSFLETRVREIGGGPGQDPAKLLALAALDIADELFRLRDDQARGAQEARERVGRLVRALQDAVAER
jgi:cell division protein ZapA (FtsZ GTPase activity inhibitor)